MVRRAPLTRKYPALDRAALIVTAVLLGIGSQAFAGDPPGGYSETVAVLSSVYEGEVRARIGYDACARQARSEGYPNIAYLFSSLSASEAIHAANFRRILSALGTEPAEPLPEDNISRKTKENLKTACDRELDEIDRKYPSLLERMRPEGHEETERFLTYAWTSEKQHRDLLKNIQSGTGFFFRTLTRRIEGTPMAFLVCTTCGSTMGERPQDRCPICGGPPSGYEELKKAP
jgi:rubrerythrin